MEYLGRELKQMATNVDFNYHPSCERMNSIHICFADDLLMYCRADLLSVRLMYATFRNFSEASGLQENTEKSFIYIVGVTNHTKQRIIEELRFIEGTLPFRYLGVPLASQKLGVNAYLPLIEKITAKITCWSAKVLSYAGRLQLIKTVLFGVHAVLFGVHAYWAQIFLLPKKAIKTTEQHCRTFLLTCDVTISKKALVSWANICLLGAAGGLHVMNLCTCNNATILKLLWDIDRKKDCLWVQWVHSYYIKTGDIYLVRIPSNASWVVRKVLEARE
ncbi:uncharacterized protein LOC125859002 [Solanum stenotomum]|uniref:uncharacterized protein LOC125859002 n=1 Tax=Solanum stenotomum TaxID=172797 RepID=UPI0020D04A50|nr:uncharacterized protein LOC125859002 [Solanum stenotomum]